MECHLVSSFNSETKNAVGASRWFSIIVFSGLSVAGAPPWRLGRMRVGFAARDPLQLDGETQWVQRFFVLRRFLVRS